MKRFAVIPNLYKDPELELTGGIVRMFRENGAGADAVTDVTSSEDLSGYDCAVVLGGDGTILHVAKIAATLGMPVAGINLGRVGYLSSVDRNDTEKLLQIDNSTGYSERMMLSMSYRGEEITALNEFVISESRATRMISALVSVNGAPPMEYDSTALIFSTPTGSSGYNVSAGGPVIDPELECTAVTPVCPHTGASCSFIYGDGAEFVLTNSSSPDKNVIISADGAADLPLQPGESVTIKKSPYKVRLIKLDNEPFAGTLLRKMKLRPGD